MSSPFRVTFPRLLPVWITATTLTIGLAALLMGIGAGLSRPGAPYGILSFEFAWTDAGIARVFDAWGPEGRAAATLSTRMDFAFLVSYGAALACGALVFGGARARGAAACAVGAACADAVENVIALRALSVGSAGVWAGVMSGAAVVKFALAAYALAYVGVCVLKRFR